MSEMNIQAIFEVNNLRQLAIQARNKVILNLSFQNMGIDNAKVFESYDEIFCPHDVKTEKDYLETYTKEVIQKNWEKDGWESLSDQEIRIQFEKAYIKHISNLLTEHLNVPKKDTGSIQEETIRSSKKSNTSGDYTRPVEDLLSESSHEEVKEDLDAIDFINTFARDLCDIGEITESRKKVIEALQDIDAMLFENRNIRFEDAFFEGNSEFDVCKKNKLKISERKAQLLLQFLAQKGISISWKAFGEVVIIED